MTVTKEKEEKTSVETLPGKHAGGRPPEITHNDAKDYLEAISEGMTQDQAADIVGFHPKTMAKWLRLHPELSSEVSRARSECVRKQIRSLNDISCVRDVKGLNAAGKAAMFLLAGYDERFRKARDGEGSGGGTSITVITAIQPQSVAGFFAAGGRAQPQMVRVLINKYGPGILGEIDEDTAMKIAAESVGEKEIGTQPEREGGQRPERARTHTPIHPRSKSNTIEADASSDDIETYIDRSDPLPESVILESRVQDQEAPDGQG